MKAFITPLNIPGVLGSDAAASKMPHGDERVGGGGEDL